MLEKTETRETKLLIPHARFRGTGFNFKLSKNSSKEYQVHSFTVHGRLGHLTGQSRDSFLFLARVYMQLDSYLPAPVINTTLGEESLCVSRWAFQSHPLTERECEIIQELQHFCQRCPSVYLLAQDLLCLSLIHI